MRLSLFMLLTAALAGCASGPEERRVRAQFDCADGRKLSVTFNITRQLATLKLTQKLSIDLPSQHPASGMWYLGEGQELRGAGDTLTYTASGQPATRCVQVR